MKVSQEELVNHLKTTGFVFNSSEIYNGLANAWDYGPLGVLLKNNIKNKWTQCFITQDEKVYSLDSSIILNPMVWKASGHLDQFSDPLIDCKNCKERFRADKLLENKDPTLNVSEHLTNEQYKTLFLKYDVDCPNCHHKEWTDIRNFNLMFKTYQGVIENSLNTLYLRPETAQGIFINFKNVQRTMRAKLPFGIGQIGKSFRNEITPGNFVFRTREFEQMELEYFVYPEQDEEYMNMLVQKVKDFLIQTCQIQENHLNFHEQTKEELAHYAKRTVDVQYAFPHGMSELWGIANRTDHDLKLHMRFSQTDLTYLDEQNHNKLIPYVIEPSVGVERLLYALCLEAYNKEQLEKEERIVMRFPIWLAPIKIAVLPLHNKLNDFARHLFQDLLKQLNVQMNFDTSGSIGKRYRRQDAIGTPFCVTVDFDSINQNDVTLRYRDSMQQERILISDLVKKFNILLKENE